MQEVNIKLFEENYTHKPEVEKWLLSAGIGSVALHFIFMVYLLLKGGFSTLFIFLYLLSALILVAVAVSYWLERRPDNRKHLTLTDRGIRYRADFLQTEQEFDWDEVDTVQFRGTDVTFILKNEEQHHVSLAIIEDRANLQHAIGQIRDLARHYQVHVA